MHLLMIPSMLLLHAVVSAKEDGPGTNQSTVIPGQYIVLLKENVGIASVNNHMSKVNNIISFNSNQSRITKEYSLGSFHGYALTADQGTIDELSSDPDVALIEEDHLMTAFKPKLVIKDDGENNGNEEENGHDEDKEDGEKIEIPLASCKEQTEAEWGLVRINERELDIDGYYSYRGNAGEGVDVYVVDTGVMLDHVELEGRAKWGTDTVDDPSPETDLNGHGTHVAGTIASKTYGVAKKANVIAVRVLDRNGVGATSGVIDGVLWVASQAQRSGRKSVANLSLGGSKSEIMNQAVRKATQAGVHFAVAAGNEFQDACNLSPASEPSAIAVACSNSKDEMCSFSNYGECVDMIAPGEEITSLWIGSPVSINTISGTSMSAPHVAGVVAKYLSQTAKNPSPKEVVQWLQENATKEKITDLAPDTENKLLFMDCS